MGGARRCLAVAPAACRCRGECWSYRRTPSMINFTLPQGRLPRIAVLGAGHVGPIIARLAVEAGYQVAIAGSGDPAQIELIVQVLAPGAEPRWAADAVREADIVVSPIPLPPFPKLDPPFLAAHLVVHFINYL